MKILIILFIIFITIILLLRVNIDYNRYKIEYEYYYMDTQSKVAKSSDTNIDELNSSYEHYENPLVFADNMDLKEFKEFIGNSSEFSNKTQYKKTLLSLLKEYENAQYFEQCTIIRDALKKL